MFKIKVFCIVFFMLFIISIFAFADINDDFITAAFVGSPDKIYECIKKGADVNIKNARDYHRTALFYLSSYYDGEDADNQRPFHFDLVKLLISKGADVNARDDYGSNALMYSVNAKISKLLIDNGADVNSKDNNGVTTLMKVHNLEIALLLMDHGADINAKDNKGKTALMHSSDFKIIKLLVNNGADINIKDSDGKSFFIYNILNSYEYDDNNYHDSNDDYDPDINLRIARFLIAHGADVNAKDNNGKTALMYINDTSNDYANDNFNMIKFLVDHGADINIQDKEGKSLLIYYCDLPNNEKIDELLLNKGINVNAKLTNGQAILDYMNNDYYCKYFGDFLKKYKLTHKSQ